MSHTHRVLLGIGLVLLYAIPTIGIAGLFGVFELAPDKNVGPAMLVAMCSAAVSTCLTFIALDRRKPVPIRALFVPFGAALLFALYAMLAMASRTDSFFRSFAFFALCLFGGGGGMFIGTIVGIVCAWLTHLHTLVYTESESPK
jgi:hypothetical protein